ncbi:MAG: hypothetical protein IBX72_02810 [Nitrospirae bacterium]|nr:hypothetical protein [Nitrospirota bacterium]
MISYGVIAHGGAGSPPQFADGCEAACERGIRLFPPGIKAGVIGISKEGFAVVSNSQMAYYKLLEEDGNKRGYNY